MIEIGPFALELILAAFAGGLFGAALGALPAFTIAGLTIVVGEAANIVGLEVGEAVGAADPGILGSTGLTASIGLGPLLGPHVAFAGGVAAAAYAADQGYMPSDTGYHPAKAIDLGLGSRPDVLAVGGLFGIFGYVVATISAQILGLPLDPIALAIVVSAFAHRAVFGYDIIGDPHSGDRFDMSPHDKGEVDPESGRSVVEPFLPHQTEWVNNAALGAGVGLLSGYIAYVTASPFLAFGLSIVTFAFVVMGKGDVPITLHMALPASIAALSLLPAGVTPAEMTPALVEAEVSFIAALLIATIFGAIAGVAGEFFARVFYAHADTHLDPPAAAIAFTTLLIGILVIAGVLPNSVVLPTP